jgi:putative DNA primase/helicase
MAALRGGDYAGLGFALGPDGSGSWQGIDLDGLSRHPDLALLVARLPGYVEGSPSGDGVHAIGFGARFETLGSNASGIEAYAAGRYFTVTGSAIGTGTIEDIGPFVATVLAPIHGKVPATRTVGKGASGSSVFAKINAKALANLSAWVPAVFPAAKAYHDGFRISSRDLGRDLEEALSILPAGIRDFGEERGLTPIDLVLEWGPATSPREAALWLCERLGVAPSSLGWKVTTPAPPPPPADGPSTPSPPRAEREAPHPDADRRATIRDYPWPEPSDITSPADEAVYPADAFPAVARDAISEYARYGRQPIPLVASSALGQMALACQGLADVARNDELRSPCSLYLLAIAESGERKSASDKQFSRAIREWVTRERETRAPEFRRSIAMAKDHKARIAGVESRIKTVSAKDDDDARRELEQLQNRLIELEQNPIVAKPLPAPTHEDVNPASLAYAVANGWPSSGLYSDEAGSVIGSQGLGEESATSLLSLMNILWDGRAFAPTRKAAAATELRGRRFSCFLMLQPDLLPKLIDKGGRSIGFLARFLICHPTSTMGSRLYVDPPTDRSALNAFDRQIAALLSLELPIDCSGEDRGALMRLTPPVMTLAPDAKRRWIAFHDGVERELCQFGEFSGVRDVASKAAENAVRIAGVFQLFDQARVGATLELPYLDAGVSVAAWHLNEAKRLFLDIDAPSEILDARELSTWLVGKARTLKTRDGELIMDAEGMLSLRDISKLGPNRVRDSVHRDDALDILVEANHVRRCDIGKQKRIQVNPKLLI